MKVEHLLDAAERRLRAGGLGAFSVAGVARDTNVAQATVYWYFRNRDQLLVRVAERAVQRVLEAKRASGLPLADEIVWFVDQLHDFAAVRAALYERAAGSPVVAEFADWFQRTLRTMLANSLRPYLETADVDLAVEVFAATVEGILLQCGDDEQARRRQVAFALEHLTGGRLRPTS